MSLRNMNIAPRAFLGFAFIALLVIALGVFAVNRMSIIRQASLEMESNQLPSVGFLGNVTENVLRLRILSFRVLVNREPAGLQEAQTRIGVLVDKLKQAQASYAALPAGKRKWPCTRPSRRPWKSTCKRRTTCWSCRDRTSSRSCAPDQYADQGRHRPDGRAVE